MLLVALFRSGDIPPAEVGRVLAGAGLLLSATWFLVQIRAFGYLTWFEEQMNRLRAGLGLKRPVPIFPIRIISARWVMVVCSMLVMLFWAVSWLYFLFCATTAKAKGVAESAAIMSKLDTIQDRLDSLPVLGAKLDSLQVQAHRIAGSMERPAYAPKSRSPR